MTPGDPLRTTLTFDPTDTPEAVRSADADPAAGGGSGSQERS